MEICKSVANAERGNMSNRAMMWSAHSRMSQSLQTLDFLVWGMHTMQSVRLFLKSLRSGHILWRMELLSGTQIIPKLMQVMRWSRHHRYSASAPATVCMLQNETWSWTQKPCKRLEGLLLMINHHMKDLYASIKKQIDASARHPLLFVRVVLPAETAQWRAWILTRAVFKPRSIDGVPVYSTKDDTNADSLNVPFVVHLDTKQVDQSDTTVPHFVCMDEIMVEMTMFCQLYPEATLQYCYNPDYTQSCNRPLTELIVKGPLRWVPVDSSTCEFDSDDDDSDVELVEIDDMLGDLMSMGVQTDTSGKKSSSRRGSESRRAKPTTGDWNGVSGSCMGSLGTIRNY